MAKIIFQKEYVLIDFNENRFKFFNIKVIKLKFNDFQIIYHQGKLGNEGKKTLTNTNDYDEAMKKVLKKRHELKADDYINKDDMKGWLGQSKNIDKKKNNYQIDANTPTLPCNLCRKPIPQNVYGEINKWGRGGGNWDANKDFIGYKKVLCIECQWEHDIYKKRIAKG